MSAILNKVIRDCLVLPRFAFSVSKEKPTFIKAQFFNVKKMSETS